MNSKQIYKKPTCFKDMLELQQALDNKLKSNSRTEQQILLSMIAEVIEFNEEFYCSHKTWKTKTDHSLDKQKEELVDIIFFYSQLLNYKIKEKSNFKIDHCCRLFETIDNDNIFNVGNINNSTLDLIHEITFSDIYSIGNGIVSFLNYFRISQDELYELYFNKWCENYKIRAEKKVEEGGWN